MTLRSHEMNPRRYLSFAAGPAGPAAALGTPSRHHVSLTQISSAGSDQQPTDVPSSDESDEPSTLDVSTVFVLLN